MKCVLEILHYWFHNGILQIYFCNSLLFTNGGSQPYHKFEIQAALAKV